jgi:HPt (histidine-containing phosphotransfer) domain-containing protein
VEAHKDAKIALEGAQAKAPKDAKSALEGAQAKAPKDAKSVLEEAPAEVQKNTEKEQDIVEGSLKALEVEKKDSQKSSESITEKAADKSKEDTAKDRGGEGEADSDSADASDSGADALEEELLEVNIKLGLSYCAEDEEFYKEVCEMYVSEDKQKELEASFEKEDWQDYRVQIHALKGTSLTIGAENFSKKCKELEFAARDNDIAFIRDNHEMVMKLYKKLLKKIEKM